MDTTNYKLERGDTVRVVGCHGMLFNRKHQKLTLADGLTLGVECILRGGQNEDFEVQLPSDILDDGRLFIHMACVELVKKGERKPATIETYPEHECIMVRDGTNMYYLAKIWYESIPKEVAEKCANILKEAYDTRH